MASFCFGFNTTSMFNCNFNRALGTFKLGNDDYIGVFK